MPILDRFRLDGRVAIVTGASSGLGVAFAIALAEAGADVVLAARRTDRFATTRAAVETGRRGLAVRTDVSLPEDCRRLAESAIEPASRQTDVRHRRMPIRLHSLRQSVCHRWSASRIICTRSSLTGVSAAGMTSTLTRSGSGARCLIGS